MARNRIPCTRVAMIGVIATVALLLLYQLSTVNSMLSSLGASQYDHYTPFQLEMVSRLRKSLKESNIENTPADELDLETAGLFTQSRTLRRVSNINMSEYRDILAAGEPVVLTDAPSCTKSQWTLDFIREKAGDDLVGIETSKSNRFYSNEGLRKEQMTIAQFLDVFRDPKRKKDYYLAEESLDEMPKLEDDVEDPSFAEGSKLDKLQIWVGAGGQVSPLHHDQWDNILCQMAGERRILLYDPLQVDRLYPKTGDNRHFSYLDPSAPDYSRFPRFKDVVQYEITVKAGELLILPSFWWHQVHHGPDVNVAINFWYVPSSLLSEVAYDLLLPP